MVNPLVARVMAINEWTEEKVFEEACRHQEQATGEIHCPWIVKATSVVRRELPYFVTRFCNAQIADSQQLKLEL